MPMRMLKCHGHADRGEVADECGGERRDDEHRVGDGIEGNDRRDHDATDRCYKYQCKPLTVTDLNCRTKLNTGSEIVLILTFN